MFCSHCGANNPDGARFCGGCGQPPAGGPAAAPQAPPPPAYQPPPPQYQAPAPQYQQPAPQYQAPQPQYAPPPPGYGAPPPAYGMPPMGAMPAANVATHLGLAIVTMILCCLPLGAFALVQAQKVKKCQAVGDYAGAVAASGKAKTYSILGIVLGGIINILWALNAAQQAGAFR